MHDRHLNSTALHGNLAKYKMADIKKLIREYFLNVLKNCPKIIFYIFSLAEIKNHTCINIYKYFWCF